VESKLDVIHRAPPVGTLLRSLLTALLAAGLLFAVACGAGDSEPDPFSGTWRSVDAGEDGGSVIIARDAQGYRLALVAGGTSSGWWRPLSREGDTLTGSWPLSASDDATGPTTWNVSIVLDGDRLRFSDDSVRDVLVKVSDATEAPDAPSD